MPTRYGGHPIRALLRVRTPVVGCPAGRLIALPLSSKRLLTHLRTHKTESRFFAKWGHMHRVHAGLRARMGVRGLRWLLFLPQSAAGGGRGR